MLPVLTPSPIAAGWRFDHSYARLPDVFHRKTQPVPVRQPRIAIFNRPLALSLGLDVDVLEQEESASLFAGNVLPEGAEPLAQAYAGHQYGHFTRLGDGRAILLGEQITPSGSRFDIQLKGPGRTAFSRGGDGRAALGPMLREYIISGAMHALGIPTTRSLAVATTGEQVFRQEPLPGAVLTRVAASHIRVGTFEWAAANGDKAALQALADHTLTRHFPELADAENRYTALLKAVIERQASLIAKWLHVGFVHGVMNTDNMALCGETIDYGPCAFMEAFDPATVFSSIDKHGRYAYGNQPPIANWNLARLAEALLPLLHADENHALDLANSALDTFQPQFNRHWLAGMRAKLGLFNEEAEDQSLIEALLEWMLKNQADFTNTFRALSSEPQATADFPAWHERWQTRLGRQSQSTSESLALMRAHNPAFIPRNHKVEEALEAASARGDFAPMHGLLAVLTQPYDHTRDHPEYSTPSAPGSPVYRTYCGT